MVRNKHHPRIILTKLQQASPAHRSPAHATQPTVPTTVVPMQQAQSAAAVAAPANTNAMLALF